MKFKPNQRVVVKQTSKHHSNRVGFFQFNNTGGSAILTDQPVNPRNDSGAYFVVDKTELDVAP